MLLLGSFIIMGCNLLLFLLLTGYLVLSADLFEYSVVGLLLLYIAGFGISLGPVAWPVMGDVTPSHLKSRVNSVGMFVNWTLTLIIGLTTLTIIEALGGGTTKALQKKGAGYLFGVFCLFLLTGFMYIYIAIPETKGKSPLQIMQIYNYERPDGIGSSRGGYGSTMDPDGSLSMQQEQGGGRPISSSSYDVEEQRQRLL